MNVGEFGNEISVIHFLWFSGSKLKSNNGICTRCFNSFTEYVEMAYKIIYFVQ